MTGPLTFLFAVAGGLAVGNLYWAQPLLAVIAADFGVSEDAASVVVTVTQIGYTLGILFLVPLGDVLDRKRLAPAVLAASALILVAVPLAPDFGVLLVTLALLGFVTVTAQILIPLAGDLADPQRRGAVVGAVTSGMLIGILASRTVSGVVAGLLGWRAIYVIAAVATAVMAILLARVVPQLPPRPRVSYHRLITSVFTAVAQHRAARWTLALGMLNFAVFSLIWTALTLLLTAAPFHYSVTQIGLVGLAGLVGSLAARRAGVLHDRGHSSPATGAALLLSLVAIGLAWTTSTSIVGIAIALVVLDIAVQTVSVLNQTRLFDLAPDARSRLTTASVTVNFIGGAIGSAAASLLWHAGGWNAVSAGAAGATVLGMLVWALGRTTLHVPAAAPRTSELEGTTQS
ncbi:MFS transporter [Streptomyces sp. NPDC056580]|uniref:MFS transporter n=1 Tax=Streptomyces sp. NPDC056580 TaxID=3345872 RepID=UPI003695F608